MLITLSSLCLCGCAAPERMSMPVASPGLDSGSAPMPVSAPAQAASHQEIPTYAQSGIASWYRESGRYKRTASGEKPQPMRFTAAHPTLPFGTIARVTSLRTGRSVLVRINDRGPFVRQRIIDVSYAAAATLGILDHGLAKVRVVVNKSDQCDVAPKSVLCSQDAPAAKPAQNSKQAIGTRNTKSPLTVR